MGIAGGPNLNQDGLVFLYDVFDQDNSYKGEPTTNKAGGVHLGFSGGRWGKTTDYPLKDSLPFQLKGDVYQLINGNNYWGSAGDFSPAYNKTYTLSYWYYLSSDSNLSSWHNSFFGEPQGGGSIYTTVSSKSNDTFSVTGTNTWRYGSVNITTSTPVNSYTYFRGTYTSGGTDNLPSGLIYITNFQLEEKSHPTPFTSSTRSTTQGLLDVVGTNQIDLSQISFDANAQMYFDGTDDYIDITSSSNLEIVDNVTVEATLKVNTSNLGSVKVIANKYSGTGWEFVLGSAGNFAFGGRNGDGTYYSSDSGVIIADNTYHHIVGVKTGLYWKTYVDGILKSTVTAGSVGTLYNTVAMQLGREGSYYYTNMYLNGFKVYNRAFTNEEVLQNYNATKSRFNLK
jgi:hypothetical protein